MRREGGEGPGHSGRYEGSFRREDSLGPPAPGGRREEREAPVRSAAVDVPRRAESGIRREDVLRKEDGRREEEPKRTEAAIRREEAGHSGRFEAGLRKEGSAAMEGVGVSERPYRPDRPAFSGPLERTLPRRDSASELRSGDNSRRESDSSLGDFGSGLRPRGTVDDVSGMSKEQQAAAAYRRTSVSSEGNAAPDVSGPPVMAVPVARRGSHSDLSATRGLSMSTSDLGAMGYKVASMSRLVDEPGPKSPVAGDDLSHARKAALRMQILELEAKTLEGLNGSRNGILAGLGKNCMKPGVSGKMGDAHKSQTESKS